MKEGVWPSQVLAMIVCTALLYGQSSSACDFAQLLSVWSFLNSTCHQLDVLQTSPGRMYMQLSKGRLLLFLWRDFLTALASLAALDDCSLLRLKSSGQMPLLLRHVK